MTNKRLVMIGRWYINAYEMGSGFNETKTAWI